MHVILSIKKTLEASDARKVMKEGALLPGTGRLQGPFILGLYFNTILMNCQGVGSERKRTRIFVENLVNTREDGG